MKSVAGPAAFLKHDILAAGYALSPGIYAGVGGAVEYGDGNTGQALDVLLRHAANLTLGWRIDLISRRDLRDRTDVYDLIRDVTKFAQEGLPVGEWTEPNDVEEALLRIFHELYSSPCARGAITIDLIDETKAIDQYDYLHLALVGAVARYRLLSLEPVTSRGLNVLAELLRLWPSVRYGESDVGPEDDEDEDERRGWWKPEPPPHGEYVDHEEALAWVIKHGVPGPWEEVAKESQRLCGVPE